ncbi:transcriptional regulator, LacI family [Ruania alba]|uniref:Transcriptional regulator, LacI family n=1 Tax=Ruania alba TaxID=648782 RepID=A0A1H5CHA3_9MICO|nr:transcriptional regulator, LacI family [Ruania alba]
MARVTISDVARRAGVTKSTVSKYLNSSAGYYVAAETRELIEAAIRELDFEPSVIARGLTQHRTMTIGLVAADIRNPFYPDLVAGVQEAVEPAGYTVVLGSTGSDPERERAIVRSMIRRQVDGVIMCSARLQVAEIESLMSSRTRLVLASRNLPTLVTDTVVVDNHAGAGMAVDHLAELGHTRIAHIAGPQDVVPFQDRLIGHRDALAQHGLAAEELIVVAAGSSTEAGAEAMATLLDGAAQPTAVFVGNDNMALGAMDLVRSRGLSVPDDISIVGFDDIALASSSFISLTTVDSMAGVIGRDAARLLLDRLAAREDAAQDDLREVVHQPVLRVRGTTGAPSAG